MKVVILCGGYGTRIRGVADNIPKPMISIGNFPILWHIMKYYASFDFKDFCICLGYKGDVIKDFFINYEANTRDFTIKLGSNTSIEYHSNHSESDWNVTLADTGIDAMTGARIKKVEKYLTGEDNFMLTYGDGLSNVDLKKLLKFHTSHGKLLTISGVRPPSRFGEMVSENNKVTEFNEKSQAQGGRISGGFFVCRKEIFDYIDENKNIIFEKEPMKKLVNDGQMMVYEHDGFWQCMDTHRDYLLLKNLWEDGKALWKKW